MIADDEEQVHKVTKMILKNVEFNNAELEFIDTYSEKETKEVLKKTPNIAVIFLDVVMENDDSGLKVVKFIREELKDRSIQIILRTGQPGQAPGKDVIDNYEINDYKEKTELTANKLYMSLIQSLRSYRDIYLINKSKHGLEKIIKASSTLFLEPNSMEKFTDEALEQLTSLLNVEDNFIYLTTSGFALVKEEEGFRIIAATSKYADHINDYLKPNVSKETYEKIKNAYNERNSYINNGEFIGYFKSSQGTENILYTKTDNDLTEIDKNLLEVFSKQLSSAFENISLKQEIIDTQKEIILKLGEVVETRSKDTANHVRRVAKYSKILAKNLNLEQKKQDLLQSVAPMHDIGKIGIPDAILKKPRRLTKVEFEVIKKHTVIGEKIFKSSNHEILKAAAIIAKQHHEKWDGTGYPDGLKGKGIHIFGRIVAVADVFDALTHKRVYKEAWDVSDAIDLIKKESGSQFDPEVVKAFLENIDEILKIKEEYSEDKG
ncbi:MAG: DUF3369 domain-containing protein [Fusobacteriota bacterium]